MNRDYIHLKPWDQRPDKSLRALKGTEDLIHTPSTRVSGYIISMFDRNKNFQSYFDTMHLHVRLVRAFQIVGGSQECCLQSFSFSSDYWPCARSQQRPTARLRGASVGGIGRNLGCTSRNKKQPQTKRLQSACGQLHLLTRNYNNQRNWGTPLMGCMRPSGASKISRMQPETTHKLFS